MIKKLVFEFIGTFILVICSGITEERSKVKRTSYSWGIGEDFLGVSMIGFFIYLALFYFGSKISGCYLNPAVTFGMIFVKQVKLVEGIVFIITQFVAGFFGALCVMLYMANSDGISTTPLNVGYFQGLILEIQMSMIFIFIFINSVISSNVEKHLKGFLIATGYMITNCATYRLTGGGNNPAKSLPLNFVRGYFDSTHIFLFAPFIGAIFSVVIYIIFS